jgi:uncharacterized membrane protein
MNEFMLGKKAVLMAEKHQQNTDGKGCASTICQMWLLHKKTLKNQILYIPITSKFAITTTFRAPLRQTA